MDQVPQKPQPEKEDPHHTTHTFQTDLERAMDTTEVSAVQELLKTAREKETYEVEKIQVNRLRHWYTTGAVILILLALGAVAFGVYYYHNLSVRVVSTPPVGVFQNLPSVDTSTTQASTLFSSLINNDSAPENKPLIVPLTDAAGRTLTPTGVFSYLIINASEPFIATLSLARLGILNTGTSVSPFLILSTPTPELATKEFLIAEPKLLELVAVVLGIDLTVAARDIGTSFQSAYMYNLPVRTLKATNVDTNEQTILMYYGYATDNTIVIATNPTVLKSVYDTIIRQR